MFLTSLWTGKLSPEVVRALALYNLTLSATRPADLAHALEPQLEVLLDAVGAGDRVGSGTRRHRQPATGGDPAAHRYGRGEHQRSCAPAASHPTTCGRSASAGSARRTDRVTVERRSEPGLVSARMELWEVIAARASATGSPAGTRNGDAGRFAEMVQVLAPDVEFQPADVAESIHGPRRGARRSSEASVTRGVARPPASGRYVPAGGRPVAPPLHQHHPDRPRSRRRGERALLLPGGALVVRARPLGPVPRRVRRRRRRVVDHQAHDHHRGRRSRGVGRAAVSAR